MKDKIVIVGGAWHNGSYKGSGLNENSLVDLHLTPRGLIGGAYVQANYVEGLLGHQVHKQAPKWVGTSIEILCSMVVAIVFALEAPFRAKIGRVLLLCVVLILLSYFLWQNLGLFFDFFIPIILLTIHAPLEQLRESRAETRRLRERVSLLEKKNDHSTGESTET